MKYTPTLLLLFLIPLIQAIEINTISESFDVQTASIVSGCKCSQIIDPIIIHNTGNTASYYSITVIEGESVNVQPNNIYVLPGNFGIVNVSYSAPCKNKIQDVSLRVTSSYDKTEDISKTFKSGLCQNLRLSATHPETVTCSDKNITYNVTLENTGYFNETYKIQGQGIEETIELGAGEFKTFNINVTFEELGDIKYTARALNNKLKASMTLPGFTHCYSHNLTLPKEYMLCKGAESTLKFNLKNNNLSKDEYEFKTNIGDVKNDSLTVEPDQDINNYIFYKPTRLWNETLKLKVYSQGDTKTYTSKLIVRDCFIPELSALSDINTCEASINYTFSVSNEGDDDTAFTTVIYYYNLTEELTIPAQSTENVTFTIPLTPEDKISYVGVALFPTEHPELRDEDGFRLNKQTESTCFSPSLSKQKFILTPKTKDVLISINQLGFKSDYYDLSLVSDIYTLNQSNLTVPETLLLDVISNKSFGAYNSTITFTTLNNKSYTFTLETRYRDFTSLEKLYYSFQDSDVANPSMILIVLSILFFLRGISLKCTKVKKKPGRKKKKSKNYFKYVLTILVFLMFAGYVYQTPLDIQRLESNSSNLYFEFYVDEGIEFNLSDYFQDPDSDELSYNYSLSGNATIEFNNSLVFIKTENTDSLGILFFSKENESINETTSPQFTLQPVVKEEKTVLEWMNVLYWHILLGFSFILLISFLFFLHQWDKKFNQFSK